MNPQRLLTALLVAVVLAGGLTLLMYNRLSKTAPKPQLTQIVAAGKDLQAGVPLTADDLTLIQWPISVALPGSFTKNNENAAVGRPLIYPVSNGQPVLDRDLAAAGSGIGLSAKIPSGMRATSVKSNEVSDVAGFMFPGSHVDVLGTFNNIPGSSGPVTQTVLQNVEVLTAGTQIEPDPQGKPQTVDVVTLLLDPTDSQKVMLASQQGTIQFVLRNGADTGKVPVSPTGMTQLSVGAPPAPVSHEAPAVHHEAPPAPKPPENYGVEVIQGSDRTTVKFPGGGGHGPQ